MTNLECLRAAGRRYLQLMDTDEIVFLSQIRVSPEEKSELLHNIATCRPLPWADWAHACVAVAVVQVAHDAEGDETSLPRLFLGKIGANYDQSRWEEEFGKRIEEILRRFFPDDVVGRGGFRYVGPVYRHAGIPLVATRKFGRLIRDLLQRYGPSFTRQEYERAREPIGGVASRFLGSEHGYLYAKNAAKILNSIDLNQVADAELDSIPGFRHGFWTEILAGAGGRRIPHASRSGTVQYTDPFLAYSVADARLELRFDWHGVQRGIYRLNERTVTNQSVACWFESRPRIDIENRHFSLDRWWLPGDTKAALFRASDGGFVTSRGGAPPGKYYLIAQGDHALQPEWIEEEAGYLSDTDWMVWRVALPPRAELKQLELHITGNAPAPELEFSCGKHHAFGTSVFESALPPVLLQNWDEANAARYLIVVDNGSRSYRVNVSADHRLAIESIPCPSTGAIKVEPRGLVRQESALSVLPFAVIPSGIDISFSKAFFIGDERASVSCAVPGGWRVICQGQERRGMWDVPARETTVDGMVTNGAFSLGFSLRVPRITVSVSGGNEHISWNASEVERVHVEGPSHLKFDVVLIGDGPPFALTSVESIGKNGTRRIEASHFNDSLRICPLSAAEFAIRLVDGTLVRSGHYFACAERIREKFDGAPESSAIFNLPGVGCILASLRDLLSRPIAAITCQSAITADPLRNWLATVAYCARSFDGTTVPDVLEKYVDPEVAAVCDWYTCATNHKEVGASSKRLIEQLPTDWPRLPVERWRVAVRKVIERLQSQADTQKLVNEWREAIRHGDGSATATKLGERNGGAELCEGARQYLVAMHMVSPKARNQSLNKAIRELERSRAVTDCLVVRGAAATLLALAYEHSGRANMISAALTHDRERAGLDESNVSPWEEDYGNTEFIVAAGAVGGAHTAI